LGEAANRKNGSCQKEVFILKIRAIGVVANIEKENIAEHVRSLIKWLQQRNVSAFSEREMSQRIGLSGGLSWDALARKAEVLVVLGGDGTMLRAARFLARHDVPILGINMGTFGYLTEVNLNEMYSALERIIQGDFVTEKRMMLEVSIKKIEKKLMWVMY